MSRRRDRGTLAATSRKEVDVRKPDRSIGSRVAAAKQWALQVARAARARIDEAWRRLAVALHLRQPPKRGLRSRLLHR